MISENSNKESVLNNLPIYGLWGQISNLSPLPKWGSYFVLIPNRFIVRVFATLLLLLLVTGVHGEEETRPPLLLTKAVMCESIEAFDIKNPAIVFPISLGKIFCFTSFENVQDNDIVFHKWFQRDHLVSNNRFYLKALSWSTFSTMQLRMADRGPWRVEITDNSGIILKTLRFSISD